MSRWFAIRVRPAAALVLLLAVAVAACQSPRSGARTQQDRTQAPPVAESDIPQYPWPEPEIRKASPSDRAHETLPPYGRPLTQEKTYPKAPRRPGDAVRVGLLLPLSGQNDDLGRAMLNAAQMAMFSFSDKHFELLPHDTRGTPGGAESAASAAISDGAELLLGPLLAPSVDAVRPYAEAAGVPVIAFSSDRTVAGGIVYTMGFLPGEEVQRVTGFALSRGMRRFGALAPDTEYGRTVVEAYTRTVQAGGGELTEVRFYDPMASDFSQVVKDIGHFAERKANLAEELAKLQGKTDEASKKMRERLENRQTLGELPFDALLVPDHGKRLQSVAAMLPYYDIDPEVAKIMGTGQWDTRSIGTEPALVGSWYAAPPPKARRDFEADYRATFGAAPPRLATLAYDATALAAVLARGDQGFSKAAITDPVGFAGRDGIFRFLPDGTVERGLAVLEVHRNDHRVISQAPDSFGSAMY